ncbi:uncharacterized protein STEHIDRAFT_167310 [Stereum hirsutum FP-91666 SS1]|uniref:uncharacterized protein n=1 Tax=Stereum hirsutum (strain FP-91666) TaxID=721885 RepID=UPI00044103CB|nr:uncharacterized protein STEHIDRAFT_167310 [Stereum hirsutum FP-91666 SS1]EIM87902.1 hypothetical protein STEHIDRAFT_167310 [Stereum hirsutum FP-91666 SS1]
MPAPTTIRHNKSSSANPRSQLQTKKKTRIVRRRGRAQDGIYSDEEFEREARSDSDSDQDDRSSIDSSEDSETEPASEDVPTVSAPHQHQVDVVEPGSSSHTPQPPDVNRISVSKTSPALLGGSTDWSEMVANEALDENGDAELPVIDFADMDHHAPAARSQPSHAKRGKKVAVDRTSSMSAEAPEPEPTLPEEADVPDSEPSTSTHTARGRGGSPYSRPYGQTARQAYQERLQKDPSYVPVVGEFWGHDDRLLDKGLRSLSNWWRGRWQTRGRGRGGFDGGFGPRGRGRGGFMAGVRQEPELPEEELPPVERQWTHDGFEELKKREERRAAPPPPPQRGGFRGGARGARGGFINNRGRGFATRPAFSPAASFDSSPSRLPPKASPADTSTRTWFAMKPERVFTQRSESSLFFDHALKPRAGMGYGYRVKLPGRGEAPVIVRAPPQTWAPRPPSPVPSEVEEVERLFTVRLPPRPGQKQAVEASTEAVLSLNVSTAEPKDTARQKPSEDDTQPIAKPPPASISIPSPASPSLPTPSSIERSPSVAPAVIPPEELTPEPTVEAPSEESPSPSSSTDGWIHAPPPDSIPPTVSPIAEHPVPAPPMLPPIQTVFSPVGHTPSPLPFGSPYSYPPALPYPPPPGVVLDQNGMPYDYATGRPVYFQPAPLPAQPTQPHHGHHLSHHSIYAPPMQPPGLPAPAPLPPRSVMPAHMPGMPFVPQHFHHHSTVSPSPDFQVQQQEPRGPPQYAPQGPGAGPPLGEIFVPPRQSSRIEIRRPGENGANGYSHEPSRKDMMSPRGPSHLRSSVVASGDGEEEASGAAPLSASSAPKTPAELVKVPEFVPSRHSHSHSQSFSFTQPPQEFYPPPGLPPLPSNQQTMNGDEQHQHGMEHPAQMYNPYAPQPQHHQQQYYYAPPGQAEGYGYDAQSQGYEGYEYGPQSAMGPGYEPQVQGYDPMVGMPGMGSPYEMYGGQPHGGTVYYT